MKWFPSKCLFLLLPNSLQKLFYGTSGTGAGMDIVVSSVRAYIGALNKMLGFKEQSPSKASLGKTALSAWRAWQLRICMVHKASMIVLLYEVASTGQGWDKIVRTLGPLYLKVLLIIWDRVYRNPVTHQEILV